MPFHPARYGVETMEQLRDKVHALQGGHLCYDNVKDDNDLRAAWGGLAVLAFYDRTMPRSGEDFDTVMGDLLADLMHLCDALGLDWAVICDKGRNHYLPELVGAL